MELVGSGYVTYRDHNLFDALDNVVLSLGLSGTYQPNLDFDSVWYGLSATSSVLQYRNSNARERFEFYLEGNINKRLTIRTTAHVGVRYHNFVFYNKSDAEELRDAAFDTASKEIYISFDHEVAPAVFLIAEYGFLHGSLTSSVSVLANPMFMGAARTEDDVFDECGDNSGCNSRIAYRIITDTHHVDLGVAFPIRELNIDLFISYFDAQGKSGQRYKDTVVALGFIWNF